jgi:hypothetical protein
MVKMFDSIVFSRTSSPEIKRIQDLKKEANLGSRQALRGLWKVGYVVITIKGERINLREMFGK